MSRSICQIPSEWTTRHIKNVFFTAFGFTRTMVFQPTHFRFLFLFGFQNFLDSKSARCSWYIAQILDVRSNSTVKVFTFGFTLDSSLFKWICSNTRSSYVSDDTFVCRSFCKKQINFTETLAARVFSLFGTPIIIVCFLYIILQRDSF